MQHQIVNVERDAESSPIEDLQRTYLDDDVPYNSSIGLFLTKRCPLRCKHCIVGSSPKEDDPSRECILEYAQKLSRSNLLSHVCITGGEPFLREDLLRTVTRILSGAGKAISVITSGYWASSRARAEEVLRRVFDDVEVFRLWISIDKYHSQYLQARHYAAAIRAADALGIDICLTATYTHQPQEAYDFIQRTIPDAETLQRVSKIRAQPLFLLGNAVGLAVPGSTQQSMPRGACGTCIGHTNAEGSVTACCSVFDASGPNPLLLGSLNDSQIDTLLEKGSSDWLIQAVRTIGPTRLANLAREVLPSRVFESAYLPHDICSVCSEIMHSPSAVQFLRDRISTDCNLRLQIATLRAFMYDETASIDQLEKGAPHATRKKTTTPSAASDSSTKGSRRANCKGDASTVV